MSSQLSTFKTIDNALALYYKRLGHSYYVNADGNGIWFQYMMTMVKFVGTSIEEELGDRCNPNDCVYLGIGEDIVFPVPHSVTIDDKQKETYIFRVLQCCYKYGHPPSDQYIKQKLIPNLNSNEVTHSIHDDETDETKHDDIKQCFSQNQIVRSNKSVIIWSKMGIFLDRLTRENTDGNDGNKDIKQIIDTYIERICIDKYDINNIIWSDLKLIRSKSMGNGSINKSMVISQKEMIKYGLMALERLNNNNNMLIPILVAGMIEWVLIVHVIHKNCDIGISFGYNNYESNALRATAIYLDKKEIESKHKLIGLKVNYCQYLTPFKNDKHLIIAAHIPGQYTFITR